MIVVGHQPQYIPHLGLFNKIAKADVFVFVDNIQFNRQSWQQRTLIKSNNSELCLTIPVLKKGKYEQLINEVEIIEDGWRKKHWKSITLSYQKAPYFDLYKKDLEVFYSREWKYLSGFTSGLMKYFFDVLGIRHQKVLFSTELGVTGKKTDLLIDICRKTQCDTYLSGAGALDYVEEEIFQANNLKHLFNQGSVAPYKQIGNGFLEGMGVIDALFMHGPQTVNLIKAVI